MYQIDTPNARYQLVQSGDAYTLKIFTRDPITPFSYGTSPINEFVDPNPAGSAIGAFVDAIASTLSKINEMTVPQAGPYSFVPNSDTTYQLIVNTTETDFTATKQVGAGPPASVKLNTYTNGALEKYTWQDQYREFARFVMGELVGNLSVQLPQVAAAFAA